MAGLAVAGSAFAGTRRTTVVDDLERSVGVIGDSITQEATPVLRALLRSDGFSTVEIDAERSRRIQVGSGTPRAGLLVLQDLLAAGFAPDAWVFALGTNDIGSYATAEDFGELIRSMLLLVPDTTPVVWVDTHLPDRLENCALFNGELSTLLRARGLSSVASWSAANSAPFEDLLRSDRIHPSERGRVVFSTLIAATLRRSSSPSAECTHEEERILLSLTRRSAPGKAQKNMDERVRGWGRPSGTGRSGSRPTAPSG